MKLVAYQAWLGMRQRGNTIDDLSLNIGVINGNAYNAVKLLVLKRGNRFLGGFFLVHFAITIIVGFSISTLKNTKNMKFEFDYPMNGAISGILHVSTVSEIGIDFLMGELDPAYAWLKQRVSSSVSPSNNTFSGTLVVRNSRVKYAVNPYPSGLRIGL